MDMYLYERPSTVSLIERMDASLADTPSATGLEVLANKVVKFLLTTKGTDGFDPEYGGVAFSGSQMSKDYLPKFRVEVQRDISRCFTFIKLSEDTSDTSTCARLGSIILRGISFSTTEPGKIIVRIEIVSSDGQSALLAF